MSSRIQSAHSGSHLWRVFAALIVALSITVILAGCSSTDDSSTSTEESTEDATSSDTSGTASGTYLTRDDISTSQTIESSADGEHAITADGESVSYANVLVEKTGSSNGENADFYGDNAAIFATNGAALSLSDLIVETDGGHANAVFSYGSGTTIDIANSYIETLSNNSGGLMVTGGGTINATNLTVNTSGNSSAAIRSDRGGGTENVTGGSYTTNGTGSPVIYCTADVTVSDALLQSNSSQGVVVEGKNSVTLNNVDLQANNVSKNSDKSDYYQAVMIYQSMSGDASVGTSSFTMNGGTLTNENGDIFFVNNTTTVIDLNNATIVNNDADGVFLRAAAAGWGNSGSNGGQVTLNANNQTIDGSMLVDDVSSLVLNLSNSSTFTGAINPSGQEGGVSVNLTDGSTWTLTEDSYVTSLTCEADSINLNGHTLYVNGEAYTSGTALS